MVARSLVLAKDLRLGARPIERDDAASTKSKPIRWNGPMGVFGKAAFGTSGQSASASLSSKAVALVGADTIAGSFRSMASPWWKVD